jgi:hypothetical protein
MVSAASVVTSFADDSGHHRLFQRIGSKTIPAGCESPRSAQSKSIDLL